MAGIVDIREVEDETGAVVSGSAEPLETMAAEAADIFQKLAVAVAAKNGDPPPPPAPAPPAAEPITEDDSDSDADDGVETKTDDVAALGLRRKSTTSTTEAVLAEGKAKQLSHDAIFARLDELSALEAAHDERQSSTSTRSTWGKGFFNQPRKAGIVPKKQAPKPPQPPPPPPPTPCTPAAAQLLARGGKPLPPPEAPQPAEEQRKPAALPAGATSLLQTPTLAEGPLPSKGEEEESFDKPKQQRTPAPKVATKPKADPKAAGVQWKKGFLEEPSKKTAPPPQKKKPVENPVLKMGVKERSQEQPRRLGGTRIASKFAASKFQASRTACDEKRIDAADERMATQKEEPHISSFKAARIERRLAESEGQKPPDSNYSRFA